MSIICFKVLLLKGAMFEKDSKRNERVCTAPSVELNWHHVNCESTCFFKTPATNECSACCRRWFITTSRITLVFYFVKRSWYFETYVEFVKYVTPTRFLFLPEKSVNWYIFGKHLRGRPFYSSILNKFPVFVLKYKLLFFCENLNKTSPNLGNYTDRVIFCNNSWNFTKPLEKITPTLLVTFETNSTSALRSKRGLCCHVLL